MTSVKQTGLSIVLKLKRCVQTYDLKIARRLNSTKLRQPSSRVRRLKGEETNVLFSSMWALKTLIWSRTTTIKLLGHWLVRAFVCMYVCMCIYMCVCVCVCVCRGLTYRDDGRRRASRNAVLLTVQTRDTAPVHRKFSYIQSGIAETVIVYV